MSTIGVILLSLVLILLNALAGELLYDAMNAIHNRHSGWFKNILILIVMLLFETAAASWMPEHLGIEIAFMEGELGGVLRSRAFLFNLGVMLGFEALGFAWALIKAVWKKIRKQENHPGWQLFMYLAVIALCAAAGLWLINTETTAPNGPTLWPDSVLLAILLVTGVITAAVVYRFFRPAGQPEAKGAAAGAPKPSPAVPETDGTRSAQRTAPAGNKGPTAAEAVKSHNDPDQAALDAFERAIAEKSRLLQAGKVEEAIQTLIAATSLPVDGIRKARLWNYLGQAYEKIDSNDLALQCYETALTYDPDRPSTHNNIALCHTWAGRHAEAKQYMDRTLALLPKRAMENQGVFYSNAALVYGRGGDRKRAEEYLRLAAEKDTPASEIESIRKQLGLG